MRTLLDETSNAPTWASSQPPPAPAAATGLPQQSPWHSPVPYLFGGLAVLMGTIAFALLILACSYWRESRNPSDDGDVEKGAAEKGKDAADKVYEEKILVIMAGQAKPTHLATPICTREPYLSRKSDAQESLKEVNNGSVDLVSDHHHHRPVENREDPVQGDN